MPSELKAETAMDNQNDPLVRARLEKLQRWRETYGITGYGHRVDKLRPLAEARASFDQQAHDDFVRTSARLEADPEATVLDSRRRVVVSGRCVQHRAMGKLVFLVLRDHSGDLQVSVSKASVDAESFKIAQKLDYGDIVVAGGPVGQTQKGEICVWADRFELHCKSLVPPPEKYHGLTDSELRYRHRYVDMYANPETMQTMVARSTAVTSIRKFMDRRGYLEVETPMMQPIAGGAAARPFVTHHNALDIDLFLRIAPELYLKRLLVGGMPRVYEINRNFRNEGIDRQHNPEFTMLEVYEAFGDCWSMLELTESMVHELAASVLGVEPARTDDRGEAEASAPVLLPFGDLHIDYARPFARISYGELFAAHVGCAMDDEDAVRAAARAREIEDADTADHWLVVSELFEELAEPQIPADRPTFVTDFPSAISPLTRPHPDAPHLSYRWELFVGGMEVANAYTELNDPEVQRARFTEQLAGADEEVETFRALDEDFIHALRVGMPPAGGLGVGIDRIVMLMTDSRSIRDVILFPLMRPES
jgi:lysyl-tRNA synthetase class 2